MDRDEKSYGERLRLGFHLLSDDCGSEEDYDGLFEDEEFDIPPGESWWDGPNVVKIL